ncbi:MAG: hypothetical protein KA250_11770 [Verrucomicrobiales bacterium]|nr:hypothetical protein [Verrucomicrobiales bacterium]MBP9225323.1 hypothetical protein [Verrucomicrobiales bacterium]
MKRLFQKVPRIVLVLAALAVFGIVRAPLEDGVRDRLVAANLLLPPPAKGAFEQMSQSALIGTLGGLRSLVATFLTLEAYDHFSSKSWDQLRQAYLVITNLEPREEANWVAVIWHLGINATANMEIDETLPAFERKRRFNEYALQAIEMAEKGLEQLPQSSAIRLQLAEVYREKLKDNCAAARVYGDTIGLPGAPGFVRRFHGYFLARCPGKEQEAYDYLMGLYREGDEQHLPTLIKEIKNMEEKLGIPSPRRIPDGDPDRPKKTRKKPSNVLPGGIIVP